MKLEWFRHRLQFKRPSGTSRGTLHHKDSYFLYLRKGDDRVAWGEAAHLPGLSPEHQPDLEDKLKALPTEIEFVDLAALKSDYAEFPSLSMALEMLSLEYRGKNHVLFATPFTDGQVGQAINGLIWMGDISYMRAQAKTKLEQGFRVLKLKIGALDFEKELQLLSELRRSHPASELEIRVDANGAFRPDEALKKLEQLAALELHSIEQPIKPGQWQTMRQLCRNSPLPVALDEELIGLNAANQKADLLAAIEPQYLILKPSLIGGFAAAEEWIALAKERGIGYWVTSALESNLGLNAIAQWNATLHNPLPSGLGTGGLYENNIESPLEIKAGQIFYRPSTNWDFSNLQI